MDSVAAAMRCRGPDGPGAVVRGRGRCDARENGGTQPTSGWKQPRNGADQSGFRQ